MDSIEQKFLLEHTVLILHLATYFWNINDQIDVEVHIGSSYIKKYKAKLLCVNPKGDITIEIFDYNGMPTLSKKLESKYILLIPFNHCVVYRLYDSSQFVITNKSAQERFKNIDTNNLLLKREQIKEL